MHGTFSTPPGGEGGTRHRSYSGTGTKILYLVPKFGGDSEGNLQLSRVNDSLRVLRGDRMVLLWTAAR
jgi:hypothetical protein